ncbi:MAG TPA: hypothetical protein VFQ53_06210 [Kofleriaceae bacterium]|nr:hypothetical protein [Kofleriaceae bacterium]
MRPVLSSLAIVAACSGMVRVAAADPATSRVFDAPTAWLAPHGGVTATGTLDLVGLADRRFESSIALGYGLGDLATIELGSDTDVRGCTDCSARPVPLNLGRASFRMGAHQDAWFRGMPALAIGMRTTYAAGDRFDHARVTDGFVVASRVLGPVRLHAGASVIDAGFDHDDGTTTRTITLGPKLRPLAGFEWTPSQYPRTSLMGDVVYVPRLERDVDAGRVGVELEWLAAWGVRYQAFSWGAIDLAVRHREDEGLGDTRVLMRLVGVWDPARRPR